MCFFGDGDGTAWRLKKGADDVNVWKWAFSPASQTPVVPFYNIIQNNSETLQTHANGTWYCKKPVSPRDRRTPLGSCKASSRSLVNLTRVDGRKPEISDDCHPFSWWDSCSFLLLKNLNCCSISSINKESDAGLSNHAWKYRKQGAWKNNPTKPWCCRRFVSLIYVNGITIHQPPTIREGWYPFLKHQFGQFGPVTLLYPDTGRRRPSVFNGFFRFP